MKHFISIKLKNNSWEYVCDFDSQILVTISDKEAAWLFYYQDAQEVIEQHTIWLQENADSWAIEEYR